MKKKIVAFFMAFILTVIPMISLAADYSTMTIDELFSEINQIRAELQIREFNDEMIICDSDGMKITIDGKPEVEESYDGSYKLSLHYIAVNTGNKAVGFSFDKICINGWEIICLEMPSLDAGKKMKGTLEVYSVDEMADIKSADEIEDIEIYGYTYDSLTYGTLTDHIRMKVVMK